MRVHKLLLLCCTALLLAACGSKKEETAPPLAVADVGAPPPATAPGNTIPPDWNREEAKVYADMPPALNGHGAGGGIAAGNGHGSGAAAGGSAEYAADAARGVRRDAYLSSLKQAAYAFNTPEAIKVAAPPAPVQFWLDPQAEANRLAEELKAELRRQRPDLGGGAEAGVTEWSPRMRATLTGEDFDIVPSEGRDFDGVKDVSATRRTTWSWDVRAKHPGQWLPLHLRVWAQIPKELGEPYEIIKLDRTLRVDVTWWWVVDHFWEKYWKWLLGSLGSALAAAFGWWWKNRKTT